MSDKTSKVLVTTEWAAEHSDDEGIRLVEVDANTKSIINHLINHM